MTKRVKYTAIWKEWKLDLLFVLLFRRGIEIGFQRLRVFVCNYSAIVTPKKAHSNHSVGLKGLSGWLSTFLSNNLFECLAVVALKLMEEYQRKIPALI